MVLHPAMADGAHPAGSYMNRDEFVGYLASRTDALGIRLHRDGELIGLPCDFHQALAVAQMLDALGRPAPSSQVLRKWYGRAAWANVEAARWVYRVVGTLMEPDLGKLDLGELMSLWVRFENWGAVAKGLAVEVRHKLRTAP